MSDIKKGDMKYIVDFKARMGFENKKDMDNFLKNNAIEVYFISKKTKDCYIVGQIHNFLDSKGNYKVTFKPKEIK